MNILAIPVQSISDLITNSSSEVFILDTGKTCEEVNDILKGFTSGFAYPEVFSLKDYREWRKKLRSGEIEEGWSYPGTIFEPFEIHDYGNGMIARGYCCDYKEPIHDAFIEYLNNNWDKANYDINRVLAEKEAIHAAMVINVQDKTIHKRQAYKCSVCHKWHVGRGKTILTDEDKRKLKIKHNIR